MRVAPAVIAAPLRKAERAGRHPAAGTLASRSTRGRERSIGWSPRIDARHFVVLRDAGSRRMPHQSAHHRCVCSPRAGPSERHLFRSGRAATATTAARRTAAHEEGRTAAASRACARRSSKSGVSSALEMVPAARAERGSSVAGSGVDGSSAPIAALLRGEPCREPSERDQHAYDAGDHDRRGVHSEGARADRQAGTWTRTCAKRGARSGRSATTSIFSRCGMCVLSDDGSRWRHRLRERRTRVRSE